jgi:hypothetical protein
MKLNRDILNKDFIKFSTDWIDTIEYNSFIYNYCGSQTDQYKSLYNHAEIIDKHKLGYGEKPFMYLWAMVFSQIPIGGKFLEIGVFKGSILTMSQLMSKELDLNISTFGLTPLNNTGDKYSKYDTDNYEYAISLFYHLSGLTMDNTSIIEGLSTDPIVKQSAIDNGPYDIVYIDGGHDYNTVVNDIELSEKILKPGGILVMDDASSLLNLSPNHEGFTGHLDVGVAIRDRIDTKNIYKHLFACGHNRVWIKNN